jgi:hypothetical protein
MFTPEQRDALRERVMELARSDARIVAGAVVGSIAAGTADRWSDVDLTFAVADGIAVGEVLGAWTRTLAGELDAVRLVDLERGPTTYRVFLFPEALQLDLSMTPASEFRAGGPKFRLEFGEASERPTARTTGTLFIDTPLVAQDIFGWGVVYALHARACIERGRSWQAEHYVGAVRDHALALACLRHGLPPAQARAVDDLPPEALDRFRGTHVSGLETESLRSALGSSVAALTEQAGAAGLADAQAIAQRIAELRAP